MKKAIIFLSLLLLSILPVFSQVVLLDSPVYLGALLIDETNTEYMANKCRAYKYIEQPKEDGFIVFISPDGEKIRFKIEDNATVVEVITSKNNPQ